MLLSVVRPVMRSLNVSGLGCQPIFGALRTQQSRSRLRRSQMPLGVPTVQRWRMSCSGDRFLCRTTCAPQAIEG